MIHPVEKIKCWESDICPAIKDLNIPCTCGRQETSELYCSESIYFLLTL